MNKFRRKLKIESLVKSALYSLLVSSIILTLIELVAWINGWSALVGVILSLTSFIISFPLFYSKKFKLSEIQLAKRIDGLGLEERVLTMIELKEYDSTIVKKQSEDAKKALEKVNASLIKFAVSVPLIIAVCAVTVLGSGLTTISALADAGVIKPGKDIIDDGKVEFVDVTYSVDDDMHGYIDGDFIQRVEKGADCVGVLAVAEDGWVFKKWSDGFEEPFRQDINIIKDSEFIAIFYELDENQDSEPDANGDQDSSKVDDSDPDKSGDGGSKSNAGSNGGSVKWSPNNQVLDNKTYYGDIYDEAKRAGLDKVSQNNFISKTGKDLISDYYKSIEPKGK